MSPDYRIHVIRVWLLVAAGCFAALFVQFEAVLMTWTALPLFGLLHCCCEEDPCTQCIPNYSGDFQVVITNMVNGTCTGCSAFNSTFVLEREVDVDVCDWRLELEDDVTCGTPKEAEIYLYVRQSFGIVFTTVECLVDGAITAGRWNRSTQVNCGTFSSYQLNLAIAGTTCSTADPIFVTAV